MSMRITVIYVIIGLLWIFATDLIVDTFAGNREQLAFLQTFKGAFYVLVTAAVLLLIVWRQLHLIACAEEEHARLLTDLRQSQKLMAIGQLAGGVAHDFNNLLTPILTYAEDLAERLPESTEQREHAQTIAQAANSAKALTGQLLAFARQQMLRIRSYDLNASIRDVHPMLRRTIREDIAIELDLPDTPVYVRADRTQIDQILLNLMINAQDAMGSGGQITITVREQSIHDDAKLENGDYVALSVADSGVGMDESTLARVFEPFFTTKGVSGTGLGLSVCYGIARQHGGAIDVTSTPGSGTAFRILIPAGHADDAESVAADAATPPSTVETTPAGPATVYVAEDAPVVRVLIQRNLEKFGHRVVAFDEPIACLEAARSLGDQAPTDADADTPGIDLLITDLVMPGMSGVDLWKQMRDIHPDLRVLFVSGYSQEEFRAEASEVGDHPFLPKPFTAIELRDAVDTALHPTDAGSDGRRA